MQKTKVDSKNRVDSILKMEQPAAQCKTHNKNRQQAYTRTPLSDNHMALKAVVLVEVTWGH